MNKTKKYVPKIRTDYLQEIYSVKTFTKLVNRAARKIKNNSSKYPFDAIAFRGTSGAALAYPLSFLLNVPLICCRKCKSHCYYKVEGCLNARNYIIVDDFIETGKTIDNIIRNIKRYSLSGSKLSAIYLYNKNVGVSSYKDYPLVHI